MFARTSAPTCHLCGSIKLPTGKCVNCPGFLPSPPCVNKRPNGYCGSCAYCKERMYGPDWWMRRNR
jgi:hypothetical protein